MDFSVLCILSLCQHKFACAFMISIACASTSDTRSIFPVYRFFSWWNFWYCFDIFAQIVEMFTQNSENKREITPKTKYYWILSKKVFRALFSFLWWFFSHCLLHKHILKCIKNHTLHREKKDIWCHIDIDTHAIRSIHFIHFHAFQCLTFLLFYLVLRWEVCDDVYIFVSFSCLICWVWLGVCLWTL